MLHEKSRPVHELAAAFKISRPAISRHLRVLKDARLVKEEKQGRENVYSLQRAQLKSVAEWVGQHWAPAVKVVAPAPKPKAVLKVKLAPKVLKAPKPIASVSQLAFDL